jgi:nucleoside-diphosphate-sugar epimerase
MKSRVALVTGANGFVGSHLVRALLSHGYTVRAMVRETSDRTLLDGLNPELVFADVTDPASLGPVLAGVDIVFHVAGAIAAFDQAGFDRVNYGGTAALVDACLELALPPERFVLVSSIAAAGPSSPERPRTEFDEPTPVSMYGRSKLRAEDELDRLRGRVATTIIRPPVVYGPGDHATLDLFKATQKRLVPRLSGPPRPMSFVFVRDLVEGMIEAATAEGGVNETFFLCGPESGTMVDFHMAIAGAMGVSPLVIPIPMPVLSLAGEAAHHVQRFRGRPAPFGRDKVAEARQIAWTHSIEHARNRFGFDPKTGLKQGVREALDWYQEKGWL